MIFQLGATLVLTAAALVVLLRTFAFVQLKAVLLGVMLLAIYFVWRPDDLTGLANLLGVDRGADLVNYISTIVLLLFIVSVSINSRHVDKRLTKLARHVAITNAQKPEDFDIADPAREISNLPPR